MEGPTEEQIYYTYILRLSNDRFYTGITNNLVRRLSEHAKGQSISTRNKLPFSLVWSKSYKTRKESRRMEVKIKNQGAKWFLLSEKYY